MIRVHLIASKSNVLEDVQTLRKIVALIKESGHEIVSNWIEVSYESRIKNKNTSADWSGIYRENLEKIAKADVVIAETSFNSLGVGYQIAMAVQQKKPTLVLRSADADADAFATGIVDEWVKQAKYDNDTLESIVAGFLEDNDIKTKDMRFNFFIDRSIYNYLRWASLKTGKTKAEILRKLIKAEIEKKDY